MTHPALVAAADGDVPEGRCRVLILGPTGAATWHGDYASRPACAAGARRVESEGTRAFIVAQYRTGRFVFLSADTVLGPAVASSGV